MTASNFASVVITFSEFFIDKPDCNWLGPLVQFFFMAEEMFRTVIAIDLWQSLTDPFTSNAYLKRYHTLVILVSGGLAVVLGVSGKAGSSFHGHCWVEGVHGETWDQFNYNWVVLVIFIIPIGVIFLISFWTLIQAFRLTRQVLPNTYEIKRRAIRRGRDVINVFVVYHVYIGVLILIENLIQWDFFSFIFSFSIGARGLLLFGLWWAHSGLCKKVTDAPPKEQDCINWALRSELMMFTTMGIEQAVSDAYNNESLSPTSKSNQTIKRENSLDVAEFRKHVQAKRIDALGELRNSAGTKLEGTSQTYTLSLTDDEGGEQPEMSYTFIDHCYEEFKQLREGQGISATLYLESVSPPTKEQFSEGKSDAFLYFTHDKRFLVKTCTDAEFDFLLRMLPKYVIHMKNNPSSLINLICGAHSITMYGRTFHFIVVQSAWVTELAIHERYDLKGSWFGRVETAKTKGTKAKCKYCGTQYIVGDVDHQICQKNPVGPKHMYDFVGKDLNWKHRLHIEPPVQIELAAALRRDATFLKDIGSLDYSLLVGIHNKEFPIQRMSQSALFDAEMNPEDCSAPQNAVANQVGVETPPEHFYRNRLGGMDACIVEGHGQYFMAIIDILKEWNFTSKAEYWAKTVLLRQDPHGISCQDPETYARRFVNRVVAPIIENDKDALESYVEESGDFELVPVQQEVYETEDSSAGQPEPNGTFPEIQIRDCCAAPTGM